MTIVNDNSRVVNKLEASLTDGSRFVIYDRRMFIVQATGVDLIKHFRYQFTQTFFKDESFHITE